MFYCCSFKIKPDFAITFQHNQRNPVSAQLNSCVAQRFSSPNEKVHERTAGLQGRVHNCNTFSETIIPSLPVLSFPLYTSVQLDPFPLFLWDLYSLFLRFLLFSHCNKLMCHTTILKPWCYIKPHTEAQTSLKPQAQNHSHVQMFWMQIIPCSFDKT